MTGFDGLGKPQGNKYSQALVEDALEGRTYDVAFRRAGQALGPGGGAYETALGTLGASGKAIVDSTLGLGKGLMWLGTAGQADLSWMPNSLTDMLPTDMATKLDSRIEQAGFLGKTGEVTGHLLALMGGGWGGGASKGVTATEKALEKTLGKGLGGAAARAGEKVASLGTLPGKALKAMEWPGRKIGEKLGKMPGVREWTAANKELLTEMVATSGGFGLYNFVQEDGDLEARAGAMLHGLFAGAAFKLIGKGADGIERRMLQAKNKSDIAIMTDAYAALKRGEGMSWEQFSKMVGPRAASTAFEGLGWAALDSRFTEALLSNDWEEAANIYAQSLPGALLARTGRVDYWETFRRADPASNTFEMRRQIIDQRRRAAGEPDLLGQPGGPKQLGNTRISGQITDSGTIYAGEKPRIEPANNAQKPQYRAGSDMKAGRAVVPKGQPYPSQYSEVIEGRPIPKPGPIGPARQITNTDTIYQGYDPGTRAIEAGASYPGRSYGFPQQPVGPGTSQQGPIEGTSDPVGQIGDRLVQAGWDIPDGVPTLGTYELEIPGTPHKVILHSPDGVQLERLVVPPSVFNAVRDMGAKSDVTMDSWEVIDEFIGDLAKVSQMRQMAGELRFQGESSAGGQFKDGERVSRVGLDGKKYSQDLPVNKSLPPVVEDLPPIELTQEPQTPELARWLELAKALRGTARPTPDLDVIEAAIVTAIEGNPESPSVQELQKFFNNRMADEIANSLSPSNITALADYLGRLGSGHATAEELIKPGGMTDVTAAGVGAEGDPMQHGQQYRDAAEGHNQKMAEIEKQLAGDLSAKERKRLERQLAKEREQSDYYTDLADGWQYGKHAEEAYRDPEGPNAALATGGTERYGLDTVVGDEPFRDTYSEGYAAWNLGDKPALKRMRELADDRETRLAEAQILGKVKDQIADAPMRFGGRGVDYNKITSDVPYKGRTEVEVGGPEFGEELVKRGGLDEAAVREILKDYEAEEINWAVEGLKEHGIVVPLGKVQAEGVREMFQSAEGGWEGAEDAPAVLFEMADGGDVHHAAEHKKAYDENEALWEQYRDDRHANFEREVGKVVEDILSNPSAAREKRLGELRKEYFEGQPKGKRKKELEKLIAGLSGAPEAADRSKIESKDKSGAKTRSLLTEIRERGGIELPGKKEIGVSSPSKEYGSRGKGIFTRGGSKWADMAGELAAEGWFGPDAKYTTEGTSYDPEGALRDALVDSLHSNMDIMHPGDKGAIAGMERADANAGMQRTEQFWGEQKDLHDATRFKGEGGHVDLAILGAVADFLAELGHGVLKTVKAPLTRGKIALDFLTQKRAEIVRKALPGDTLADEIHRAHAIRRRHRGEATALWQPGEKVAGKVRKKSVELHPKTRLPAKLGESTGQSWEARVPGVSKVEIKRWELVADKLVEADGEAETTFQQAAQATTKYLWEEKRKVGGVQGSGSKIRLLGARKRQVMPRMRGGDWAEVMNNEPARKAWFKVMEILNPEGPSAEIREKMFREGDEGLDVVTVDRKSHLEKIRGDDVMPMSFTFEGHKYQMRVEDPRDVFLTLIRQQAGEIGATEQWGQDIDAAGRDRLERILAKEPEGWEKVAVQANLDRGGTVARRDAAKAKLKQGKIHPDRRSFVEQMIDQSLELAQGGSLDNTSPVGRLARLIKSIDALPRAIMTIKAPVWDVPEYFVLPLISGTARDAWETFKTLAGKAAKWQLGELLEEYERAGAITTKMGALLYEQPHDLVKHATKAFGYLGEKAEIGKALLMSVAADVQLARFAQRKATAKDAVRFAAIDLPPDTASRLMDGTFTMADADLFRTQFVRYWTRRAEQGEGVPASDDPIMSATFRFIRFYGEQSSMIRKAAEDTVQGKEGTVFDRIGHFAKVTGGFAGSNAIGIGILGIAISALLRGDDSEDMQRRIIEQVGTGAGWREIMGRAFLGGPQLSTFEMLTSPTVRGFAEKLAPMDIALAVKDTIAAIGRGEGAGATLEAFQSLHLLPLEADMKRAIPRLKEQYLALAAGRALSMKTRFMANRDLVLDYLGGPGKQYNQLGLEKERSEFVREHVAAYYDKVQEAVDVWMREEAQAEGQGWAKARPLFQEAVNMDDSGPSSVAASIRSRTMSSMLKRSDADWSDFVAYAGEERAAEINAQDRMLSQLARSIGRMEGELPADWEGRMQELRRVLVTGGGNHKDMVDEAVERAARAYRDTKSKDWDEIEEIAAAIANHREPLIDIVGEDRGNALWSKSYARRSSYLRGMLLNRVASRVKTKLQRQAEEIR